MKHMIALSCARRLKKSAKCEKQHLVAVKFQFAWSERARCFVGEEKKKHEKTVAMDLVSVVDYEKKASELLAKKPWDFYRSGADDELSLQLNRTAYDRLRLRPRVLVDVSSRSTKCNVLGFDLDLPVAIAPTSLQKMAHSEGERATARAASNVNTIYTMSTLATSSIEEVATAAPNAKKWFQLYVYKDRAIAESLVRRAEQAGFKALVLTVDFPVCGMRRSDARNQFQLPSHLKLANFADDKTICQSSGGSGIKEYVSKQYDPMVTWKDVQWLVNFSKLPVILKGIMTREDALLALDSGCKGIIVSNHGGRQLDSVPATIEALPEIVNAVGHKLVVMIDGGIRNGTDVFKAIALGAQLVFVGRPVIYGLAVNGQSGVESVFNIIKSELDLAMALSGVTSIKDINPDYVVHESHYKLAKL